MYATESGAAIVLDRRGREGKRKLAGRKMRGKPGGTRKHGRSVS